jgi:sugar phosphate permease
MLVAERCYCIISTLCLLTCKDAMMLRSSRLTVFACFTLGYFISFFFRSANAVIARDLSTDFAIGAGELGLMTSLFFIAFAAMQLPIGVALDRYGPRVVTPAVMLLAAAGALVFSIAPSFGWLALGRALIGAGMACGLMGLLKAFGAWFAPARVATISGVAVGIGALGGLAASAPLAQLNALVGWRLIFVWAAAATGIVALMIALLTANSPGAAPPRPTIRSEGLFDGFGQIFRDLRFWRIAPLNFFVIGTAQAVQTLWGGPYLVDVLHMSKIEAGYPLLALSLGVAIGYMSSGWLADRYGQWRVMIFALFSFLVAQLPLVVPGWTPPIWLIYPAFGLFGYAGAYNLLLLAQVRVLFPLEMSGRATTACNMFGFVGTALIQGLMGLIIGRFPISVAGQYPPIAYTAAFFTALLGCVGAILWYLPLAKRQGAR